MILLGGDYQLGEFLAAFTQQKYDSADGSLIGLGAEGKGLGLCSCLAIIAADPNQFFVAPFVWLAMVAT